MNDFLASTELSDLVLGTPAPGRSPIINPEGVPEWGEAAAGETAPAHPAVIQPAMQNGWLNAGGVLSTAGYYKDASGRVWVKGVIRSGALGAVIWTMPEGFWPPQQVEMSCHAFNGVGLVPALLEVTTSGEVRVVFGASNAVHLDGLSFLAAP